MKTKGFWILLVLVVLLLAVLIAGVCIHSWWHSPGVHVLGSRANIDLRQSAYVIDEYTGEVVGTTNLIIAGQVDGTFDGFIQVEDYPLHWESLAESTAKLDKPYLDIFCRENLWQKVDGEAVPAEGDCAYDVMIHTGSPEKVIVHVTLASTGERYYVVHADSGEDALHWLNEYNKGRYGEDYPAIG